MAHSRRQLARAPLSVTVPWDVIGERHVLRAGVAGRVSLASLRRLSQGAPAPALWGWQRGTGEMAVDKLGGFGRRGTWPFRPPWWGAGDRVR